MDFSIWQVAIVLVIALLVFERMAAPPDRLYGSDVGSNYQNQVTTLGKHFLGGPRPRFDTG